MLCYGKEHAAARHSLPIEMKKATGFTGWAMHRVDKEWKGGRTSLLESPLSKVRTKVIRLTGVRKP